MAHTHHHADVDISALRKACVLITSFMLVELGVGLWANALVLIADAGHMFIDATALALLGGLLIFPSAAMTNNCLTATTAFRCSLPLSTA